MPGEKVPPAAPVGPDGLLPTSIRVQCCRLHVTGEDTEAQSGEVIGRVPPALAGPVGVASSSRLGFRTSLGHGAPIAYDEAQVLSLNKVFNR